MVEILHKLIWVLRRVMPNALFVRNQHKQPCKQLTDTALNVHLIKIQTLVGVIRKLHCSTIYRFESLLCDTCVIGTRERSLTHRFFRILLVTAH